MAFSSVEGLLQAAGQGPLWRAVLEDDLRERGVDEARSWGQMAALWTAMKAPVEEYDPAARSRSGLTGGAGARLEGAGPGLCPPFLRAGRRWPPPWGRPRCASCRRCTPPS